MRPDNPKDVSALGAPGELNDAIKLHEEGRLAEAETIYQRILETQPDHFASLHLLGAVELQRCRYADAIRRIDAAISCNPNVAEAHNNRGTALRELKRFDEALTSHDQAIALKPDYAEAFNNRGNVLLEMKCLEEALAGYDKAIALKPGYAEALNNRGNTLLELARLDDALASFDAAIAFNPGYANAFNNRGNVLVELGRFDEALESYDKAIAHNPDHAGAFFNRASVLRELGRLDDAAASYDRAVALRSDYADALYGRAMLDLLRGRYREGLPNFEWRWKLQHIPQPPGIDAPAWQGEDLNGRHIVVYYELHLGDVIQFARYVPLLSERGATVTFVVPVNLVRLLRRLVTPAVTVVGSIDPGTRFDFKCALMSLPLLFGTEVSAVPSRISYLSAEADLVARWKDEIGSHGFKIGVSWQGRPQRTVDRRRFALADLAPLARVSGVRLISLQKNDGVDQLQAVPAGCSIETLSDFDSGPDAFIDTAAVMKTLDLVITSDTSIAHVAGALGRRTWVALKYVPEWRWLLDRDDTPWYPTLRLFRQQTIGDWASVFATMERELRALVR
jgi:tetratricopeptide (TPR) repeat protein